MAYYSPRHIVWSTNKLDLRNSFQKRWLLRQTLMHGIALDIRGLDFKEIKRCLDDLNLPDEIDRLWRRYFAAIGYGRI
jgi:hypothetical protein